VSLDWIGRPELDQNELRELLVASYVALLNEALKLDPKADKNVSEKRRRSAAGG
jgi:hypothetical protein